jgi:hypothetical protein
MAVDAGVLVTFSTCNSETNYDTRLSYGTNCSSCLYTKDDDGSTVCPAGSLKTTIIVGPFERPTTVRLLVSGYTMLVGRFRLDVACTSQGLSCASAVPMECGVPVLGTTTFSNVFSLCNRFFAHKGNW